MYRKSTCTYNKISVTFCNSTTLFNLLRNELKYPNYEKIYFTNLICFASVEKILEFFTKTLNVLLIYIWVLCTDVINFQIFVNIRTQGGSLAEQQTIFYCNAALIFPVAQILNFFLDEIFLTTTVSFIW